MQIKNKRGSIIWKCIVILVGLSGISMQLGFWDHSLNLKMLNYFTVLSNLAVVLYDLCAVVWMIKHFSQEGCYTWCPVCKSIITMSILVTFGIANTMLGGMYGTDLMGISMILLHLVVPIMTVLDWILFDEKGLLTLRGTFLNLAAPLLYFTYVMIAARQGEGVGIHGRYPYPFLDVDHLGVGKVVVTAVILVIIFWLLGVVLWKLDQRMFKRNK